MNKLADFISRKEIAISIIMIYLNNIYFLKDTLDKDTLDLLLYIIELL